jgi:two-component system, NtrC family, response regulator GlrR
MKSQENYRSLPSDVLQVAIVSQTSGQKGPWASWRSTLIGWDDLTPRLIAEHDLILLDLTRVSGHLTIGPEAAKHCIAVLSDSATAEDLAFAAKSYPDFYVGWPTPEDLLRRFEKLVKKTSRDCCEEALFAELGLHSLRGSARSFRQEIAKIPMLGRTSAPVLIAGETGTGKELCARAVHFASRRRGGPFIVVDCAALPDHLVENELFGHAQGAYTDARTTQKGLVALAERGSLFLDEIDSLSLAAQGKLLRFLEDRVYRPLGSERFLKGDVRLLAATNRPLEELVGNGKFRSDLFYRLNVLVLNLPPLRERVEDIRMLAQHFIAEAAREFEVGAPRLSEQALRQLEGYDWPGNVRELKNIIRRAVALCEGADLSLCDKLGLVKSPGAGAPDSAKFKRARQAVIEAFERNFVQQLLAKHCGNITRAAGEAGKERRAFGRLVKKHRLAS